MTYEMTKKSFAPWKVCSRYLCEFIRTIRDAPWTIVTLSSWYASTNTADRIFPDNCYNNSSDLKYLREKRFSNAPVPRSICKLVVTPPYPLHFTLFHMTRAARSAANLKNQSYHKIGGIDHGIHCKVKCVTSLPNMSLLFRKHITFSQETASGAQRGAIRLIWVALQISNQVIWTRSSTVEKTGTNLHLI